MTVAYLQSYRYHFIGLSLPSYEKTTRPLGRLAPLSTNQSELPMDDDGTERKTKVKKKKRKLKEPKGDRLHFVVQLVSN